MTSIFITLAVLLSLLALGNWMLEHLCADSAMQLAIRIENETKLMRRKHEARHTFAFCPKCRTAKHDYRIELHGPGHRGVDEPVLCVAASDDDDAARTKYHRHFVSVPRDLAAVHHPGEPTLVTLENRGGEICVTELK